MGIVLRMARNHERIPELGKRVAGSPFSGECFQENVSFVLIANKEQFYTAAIYLIFLENENIHDSIKLTDGIRYVALEKVEFIYQKTRTISGFFPSTKT